jgi:hypothetical protein
MKKFLLIFAASSLCWLNLNSITEDQKEDLLIKFHTDLLLKGLNERQSSLGGPFDSIYDDVCAVQVGWTPAAYFLEKAKTSPGISIINLVKKP